MSKKITKQFIKRFEKDQSDNGTEVALYNLFWCHAAELLREIGVKGLKTT